MSVERQKGTFFETMICKFIKVWKPQTERRGMQGRNDRGDIYIPGEERFILECKNQKTMKLAMWIEEARTEAVNAGVPYGVVVHKRKGTQLAGEQYVTMPLFAFLGLVYGDPD